MKRFILLIVILIVTSFTMYAMLDAPPGLSKDKAQVEFKLQPTIYAVHYVLDNQMEVLNSPRAMPEINLLSSDNNIHRDAEIDTGYQKHYFLRAREKN